MAAASGKNGASASAATQQRGEIMQLAEKKTSKKTKSAGGIVISAHLSAWRVAAWAAWRNVAAAQSNNYSKHCSICVARISNKYNINMARNRA
jgi:hypothetical protein